MSKKKKKEKVIYYDDNSTIADMSNVTRIGQNKPTPPPAPRQKTPWWEKWHTFWTTFKLMLIPTGIALTILAVLYLLMMWLGGNFG